MRAELEIALSHPHLADWPTVVKAALEDTERLQELTTDLLLLARLDADALDKQDTVDLTAVVQREVSRRAMVTLEADDNVLVPGRRAQLSRLLGNLLDNAERHAGTEVMVRLRGGSSATLEVIDDGPGIPEADRERVFDRFTRLDEARTRAAGGAGLGLAIARRIATRHHGTLEATDAEGFRGIRFLATIPTGIPQPRKATVVAQQRVRRRVAVPQRLDHPDTRPHPRTTPGSRAGTGLGSHLRSPAFRIPVASAGWRYPCTATG
ncbi:histidine kinase/DNA gyrase B/HSP90-like ATPase [Lentzea atacamensis]|uniref:histidine kinase n=1 Tax=Lentzea atacamensis TaxID=531938 RepID=A0ABX9ELV7_9PSEU|nr:sensor histidine kinase [Lentzea atacamensis]RAS70707.1 histidine kinase/DNA gyrase B/HSP90-like ATPase [Lentzea atacamensis]